MPPQQQNELVKLQAEITNEVQGDAPHIARMVFGDAKDHPDMVGVPNASLDDVYRKAFLNEDRQWLQAEARRDPEQFLKVAERIGAKIPPPMPPVPPPMPAPAQPMVPPPPAAMPAPMPPPVAAVVAPAMPVAPPLVPGPPPGPAPVILGPNGMPLPPSGLVA